MKSILTIVILYIFPIISFGQKKDSIYVYKNVEKKDKDTYLYNKVGDYIGHNFKSTTDTVYRVEGYTHPGTTILDFEKDEYVKFNISRSNIDGFGIYIAISFIGKHTPVTHPAAKDSIIFLFADSSKVGLQGSRAIDESAHIITTINGEKIYNYPFSSGISYDDILKFTKSPLSKVIFKSKISGVITITEIRKYNMMKYVNRLLNETQHFKILYPEKKVSLPNTIKIGGHKFGGIVFKVDYTGKHGTVIMEYDCKDSILYSDIQKILDTIKVNGLKGWRIPNNADWIHQEIGLYRNSISEAIDAGLFYLPQGSYWSIISLNHTIAPHTYTNSIGGNLSDSRYTLEKNKNALRLVRDF